MLACGLREGALAISAAIFDLDGTLVDNMRFHAEAWAALFARLGHPVPPERFAVELAGRKSEEIFTLLLGHALPKAESERLINESKVPTRWPPVSGTRDSFGCYRRMAHSTKVSIETRMSS